MRKYIIIPALLSLTLAACGGSKGDSNDAAFEKVKDDPIAFQKEYCKQQGWQYEAASNSCKR
jgi:hypothetical protein